MIDAIDKPLRWYVGRGAWLKPAASPSLRLGRPRTGAGEVRNA
jgi:hypothetical protein